MSELVLHTIPMSSAGRRVRIALRLKGLAYREELFDLYEAKATPDHGYRRLNPQVKVPSLVHGDLVLTQSMAILEYLEETFPEVPLLPADAATRARARMLAQIVACEVHPLQNSGLTDWMQRTWDVPDKAARAWQTHWIDAGLSAIEGHLDGSGFSVGDAPTVADCCLIPQVGNARYFGMDLAPYPKVQAIERRCLELDAFQPG